MPNEPALREAARGIPVWEGAAGLLDGSPVRVVEILALPNARTSATVRYRYTGGGPRCFADSITLDLSDPDTRVAYERRLALALGAPEHLVERGVGASLFEGALIVQAGFYDSRLSNWAEVIEVNTIDPLLARALAWPADKRVPHTPP